MPRAWSRPSPRAATVKRVPACLSEPVARTRLPKRLFLDEDTDLMTPAEAMALVPRPELLSYR